MSGAPIATSTPGMDLWRPGERMATSEAAWLGAAWGISMHAILSFFSLWFAGLKVPLRMFAPAERLGLGLSHGAPPFIRWVVLLASLATFWALVAVALVGAGREARSWFARRRGATASGA